MALLLLPPRHVLPHRLFPMPAVEFLRRDRVDVKIVETACIDVDLVRVGTRYIERMHAAVSAERMLRDAGVEGVRGQVIPAAEQLELLARHDQMPDALLGAD